MSESDREPGGDTHDSERGAMAVKAFVSGCAGTELTGEEQVFFAVEQPLGLILFKRNCDSPAQVRALVDDFRNVVGRADAPVLIDQEGGRVRRLRPPNWPDYPAARVLGDIAAEDAEKGARAAWLHGRLMAADLHDVGITVDCTPVLDVITPGASDAIGNRSFGGDPVLVARLGRAVADGLIAGGVAPVVKHIPGQGRAAVDSHYVLPVVEADIETLAADGFRAVRGACRPAGGDDQPHRVQRRRSDEPGDHFRDRDPRYHPGANRFRRSAVQR